MEEGKACMKAARPTLKKLPLKVKRKLRKFARKLKKVAKDYGNKDGKINKVEFVATAVWVSCSKRGFITKKSGAACKKFLDLGPKVNAMATEAGFDAADSNKDGKVGRKEYVAAVKAVVAKLKESKK